MTYAARLGVSSVATTDVGCDEGCCNASVGWLDLREDLRHEGVRFEFAREHINRCEGDDSGVCCPVPPHTKDGGGLVLATGTVRESRLDEVVLCRPRPEDYPQLDFTFGKPPLP